MKNPFRNFEVTPNILIPLFFISVTALIYCLFNVVIYWGLK